VSEGGFTSNAMRMLEEVGRRNMRCGGKKTLTLVGTLLVGGVSERPTKTKVRGITAHLCTKIK